MKAHLELMSKPRLIGIIHAAEARAQQHAEMAEYWRGLLHGLIDTTPPPEPEWTPEGTLAQARRILRSLPADPLAQQHRDDLLAALNQGGNVRRPGPRCAKDDNLLNPAGMCPRCDWYRIRKAREAA